MSIGNDSFSGSDAPPPPGTAGGFSGAIPGGRRFLPVIRVVVLGVGVSLAAFFALRAWQDANTRAVFENRAQQHTAALRHGVAMGFTALRSVRGLFAISQEVTPAEFEAFTGVVLRDHPGIAALSWVPRVPTGEGRAYERARDGALAVATARRPLGGDKVDRYGVAIVEPIYRNGLPHRTVAERRANLAGFVRGVFDIGALVESALENDATPAGLDVYLYDDAAPPRERLLYYHPSQVRNAPSPPAPENEVRAGLHWSGSFEIGTRRWTALFRPVPDSFHGMHRWSEWGLLAIGLGTTALLVAFQITESKRNSERERAAATLRESEHRLSNLAANLPGVVYQRVFHSDGSTSYPFVSAGVRDIYGYEPEEISAEPAIFRQVVAPEDRESFENSLAVSAGTMTPWHWEGRIRNREGRIKWVQVSSSPRPGEGGCVIWDGLILDISRRKQAEEARRESDARYARAVAGTNDGLWDWNVQTAEDYFSPRWAEIVGYRPDELEPVMETFVNLLHPDDRAPMFEMAKAHFERHEPYDIKLRLRHKNGEYIWVRSRGQAIRDDNGCPLRMAGSITDITESVRAEEALRESEAQFRLVTEALPVFIAYVDAALRYRFINRCGAEWNALPRGKIIGQRVGDIVSEATYRKIEPHMRTVLGGADCTFEEEISSRDGNDRIVEVTYLPHFGGDGKVRGFFILAQDITKRKRAEEALRAAKERAELADRAKSEFLANMSHELRTPLNAIIGFSEMIRDGIFGPLGNPKYVEYCADINAAGVHLLGIVNDILDLSKIEAGKIDLDEEDVAVAEIVDAVFAVVKNRAASGGLRLERRLADDLPGLYADKRKLKQILLNLLANAIKFTPAGGRVTLSVAAGPRRGFVFKIADTGIGIAADDIPKIMAPFGQVESDLDRRYEGTGLGLPLSKAFTEMHGGSLEIESAPGRGTTVIARFPPDRIITTNESARRAVNS